MLMKLTPGLAVLFDDGDAGDVGAAALVQVEVLQLERDCSRQEEGVLLRLAQPLLLHVDVGYFRLFRHFLRTTEKWTQACVNFINILRELFSPISFRQKVTKPNSNKKNVSIFAFVRKICA